MEVISAALLGALGKKLIDQAKFLTNGRINDFVTQAVAWGVGIVLVWLCSSTTLTENLLILGQRLGDLDGGGIVLAGLAFGSGFSVFLNDIPSALDNNDTAATPQLLPRSK